MVTNRDVIRLRKRGTHNHAVIIDTHTYGQLMTIAELSGHTPAQLVKAGVTIVYTTYTKHYDTHAKLAKKRASK